jgi:hypothetical protein
MYEHAQHISEVYHESEERWLVAEKASYGYPLPVFRCARYASTRLALCRGLLSHRAMARERPQNRRHHITNALRIRAMLMTGCKWSCSSQAIIAPGYFGASIPTT